MKDQKTKKVKKKNEKVTAKLEEHSKAIAQLQSLPDSVKQTSDMVKTLVGSQSQPDLDDLPIAIDGGENEDVVENILNGLNDVVDDTDINRNFLNYHQIVTKH